MAIVEAVSPARFLVHHQYIGKPTNNNQKTSSRLPSNQSAAGVRKLQARGRVPGGGGGREEVKAEMVKGNRSLSTGAGKSDSRTSNSVKTSTNSNDSKARPINVASKKAVHRRGSSQTLTLDLEGLDLGRGAPNSDAVLESTMEEVAANRKPESYSSPTNLGVNILSRSWGRPSVDTTRLPDESLMQKAGEDTFFAHLRNCEESNDILRSEDVLSSAEVDECLREYRIQSNNDEDSKQVLGGFASLGYDSNANSRNTLNFFDMDQEASGSSSSIPASPRHRTTKLSSWRTLHPILQDPMNTLDILSIEEMGLHSIDVGSSEDWEGVTLTYPCTSCDQGYKESEGVDAEWAIARSMKRQRKWIVTPISSSSSRTVVISDHITTRQDQQNRDRAPAHPFSGQSTFELRFLQAGTSAPNSTIILASPATHRKLAAKDDASNKISTSDLSTPSLSSMGVNEELSRTAAATPSTIKSTTSTLGNDDNWPTIRSKAAKVAKKESRSILTHSKSSSTIHATLPMIQLESRRPSLGKSISHESLAFTATRAGLPSSESSPRQSLGASSDASLLRKSLRGAISSDSNFPRSPILDKLPSESFTPFGDYSIELDSRAWAKTAEVAISSPIRTTRLGPSPRTSMQDVRGQSSMRETPSDLTPVLSKIDPARMAEYHRLEMVTGQGLPSISTAGGWNNGWAAPPASNSSSAVSKSSLRKDRRLSDWIKKKVLPNGAYQSGILSPPLPPAWEQRRDYQMTLSPSTNSNTIRGNSNTATAATVKGIKNIKALSSASKSSVNTMSSSTSPHVANEESGDTFSILDSPIAASNSSLSLSKVESKEADSTIPTLTQSKVADSNIIPLSQMHTYHGDKVWPGVAKSRNERRRSNSDDNLVLLGEVERRRLEVLGKEGASRKGRMTSLRGNAARPDGVSNLNHSNNSNVESDSMMGLSSSMPIPPAKNLFNEYNRRMNPPTTSIDLLGLEDIPAHSITMIIPLPLSKNVDSIPIRYLRVSFIPFAADSTIKHQQQQQLQQQQHEEEVGKDSIDLAMLPPSALSASHGGSTSNWYKKLTNAWTHTSARSGNSSPGGSSNEEEEQSIPTHTAGGLGHVHEKRRNSTVESFRIIAKVLDSPTRSRRRQRQRRGQHQHQQQASSDEEDEDDEDDEYISLLPSTFPFPVILGVCDRQRSLKLIPEGWQAINLANGPIEANTNSPLEGLADLIIAGCAACMDL